MLIINQNCFDFIHFRGVAQGIAKWPEVLKDAYRCLKPGGYVELSELSSKFSSFPSVTVCLSIPAVRRCGIESEEILSTRPTQRLSRWTIGNGMDRTSTLGSLF
jgi:ubiquinone/menaquinone biosynthesis C-methylase UbiE